MAKTAYVNVRVSEEDKSRAEAILNELGINTSTAIDIFLKQIILKEGLPFDVKIPKIKYEEYQSELASIIHFTKKKQYPLWFRKISELYALGVIDHDVAVLAVKKCIEKEM